MHVPISHRLITYLYKLASVVLRDHHCKLNETSDREGGVKMVLAFGRYACLTSLLLILSAISTLVCSQAPSDAAGQTCDKPTVPDGMVRLLDAGWYSTLLSGGDSSAGWQIPAGSVSG